jgi:quercetin dioxygenase-like cupin family protein
VFNKESTALKVQEGADQMSAAVSIVRADGEGERLRFWGGGVMTMKATAEETGGAFLLFEDLMAQGKTTPLHLHENEDEALYVLEGELLVYLDGNEYPVGPRGVAIAPRGVPHAFLVTSRTARVLTLQTPGSAEAFYRGASEPANADTDPSGPVDFACVRESADRSGGMQVVGPPPFRIPAGHQPR